MTPVVYSTQEAGELGVELGAQFAARLDLAIDGGAMVPGDALNVAETVLTALLYEYVKPEQHARVLDRLRRQVLSRIEDQIRADAVEKMNGVNRHN